MTRPKWLVILTQHGEQPPAMLKFRSSDGFIIGTVALAVFTVSMSEMKLDCLVELQSVITYSYFFVIGYVFVRSNCSSDSVRSTKPQPCGA